MPFMNGGCVKTLGFIKLLHVVSTLIQIHIYITISHPIPEEEG